MHNKPMATHKSSNNALFFAWLFALAGTLGSLYLGEIKGMSICSLCWYQRIMLYPLALMLLIAAYRSDKAIIPYSIPLVLIGGGIALYHYLLQTIPGMAPIIPCADGNACHEVQMELFGFLTLPLLSLMNFSLILIFLIIAALRKH